MNKPPVDSAQATESTAATSNSLATQASIEQSLKRLYDRINYERQPRATTRHFKLKNLVDLLERLGNPHLACPVIHVAGTKGKGSVVTMTGQILTASGRKTGVYTSPHLERINQRMTIDGVDISDRHLVEILQQLQPFVDAMDAEAQQHSHRRLTFFEITTAASFLFFAQSNCDAVVLETGLGGRLDSTNVCAPAVCVITNISLDHTRQLGSTTDKIAFEKAGIIKPGVPVVSGVLDPLAAPVISNVADDRGSPLVLLGRDFEFRTALVTTDPSLSGDTEFGRTMTMSCHGEFSQHKFEHTDIGLSLIGHHQHANAALAIATAEVLIQQGWAISAEAIRTGLRRAKLAGRTEIVQESPLVILDIAHNEASINALAETLQQELAQWRRASQRTLILAISKDKDAEAILASMIPCFDRIVLTRFLENPRCKSERELAKVGAKIRKQLLASSTAERPVAVAELTTQPTPVQAWESVFSDAATDEVICVAGSVFLVAELRGLASAR